MFHQKVFNLLQGINVYPLDCAIGSPRNTYSLESDLSSKKHWARVEEYVRVEDFACESHAEQVQAGTKGVGNKTTKKSCRCLKRFCLSFKTFLIYQVFGRRSLPLRYRRCQS